MDALEEEWFTLDSIEKSASTEPLYCISVAAEDRQFLAGELGVPTHNSEEGKAQDELKGEANLLISSIARLGRAAGVHLVLATQRPDATILPGETKANLGVRVNCGRTDSNASSMILGNAEGTRVKANPRGRLYLRIYGAGDHGQGFFASPDWIDEYLASKGLNADGTPIAQPASRLAKLTDFNELAEANLDEVTGVDNSAVIERIRQEEAERALAGSEGELAGWDFEDDEGDDPAGPVATSAPAAAAEPPADRPLLGTSGGDSDRFYRPEDDWDQELENLIEENHS